MKKRSNYLKHRFLKGLCSLMLVLLALCTGNSLYTTGGGSDTEVSGRIVSSGGKGNPGIQVMLISASYNPAFDDPLSGILVDTTDISGMYSFTGVTPGSYIIQAKRPEDGNSILINGISAPPAGTAKVADDSLRKPAALSVFLSDSVSAVPGYLYMPGTSFFRYFSAGALAVNFDSIPQGVLPSIQCKHNASSLAQTLFANVVVDSSASLVLYPDFSRGRAARIGLNTTASGAAVPGAVYSFPVLVRLTNGNFNFSEARTDGGDLRFTKSSGTPLPYEIERWDAAGGLAEIWVRVDTVYGNNSSQNIMMYWGNPGAISASNGAAVFDTSASGGFQGVWHLNEANGLAAKDATVNHFDGTPSDTAPLSVAGMIGPSQRFDGTSTFLTMSGTATGKLDFQEYGTYTVSAWVETDSLKSGNDSLRQYIVSKGNPEYTLQMNITNGWDFGEYVNATKWNYVASTGTARVWSYVVGVRSGTTMYLYVNGVFADSTVKFSAVGNTRNSTDLVIGRHAGGVNTSYFDGIIDEVRISSVSCSADWIKLCYMNQKSTDALIEFRN